MGTTPLHNPEHSKEAVPDKPKETEAMQKPKEMIEKTKEDAQKVIEHSNKLAKKYPLEATLNNLKKNPNYLREMSDEEYKALKHSLSSLVNVNTSDILELNVNEYPQSRSYVGLRLKNGGFLQIDTNKMVAYSVRGGFMSNKKHFEAPLNSNAVRQIVSKGGKLHDYVEQKNPETSQEADLPTMESFKDNIGPIRHLLQEITKQQGIKFRHALPDKTNGLTGGFSLKDSNSEKVQEVINSFNEKEIVQGYIVNLRQNRDNPDMIDYEYREK